MTNNQEAVLALIRSLTGQANVLVIPRLFVDLTGKLETALFLSQLLYWSDKGKRSDGFIYKSRKEWQAELALSDYSVRKATNELKKMGLLETKLHRARGAPTLHYRLNQKALLEALLRFVEINESDLRKSTNQICRNQQNPNIDYTKTTEHVGVDLTEEQQTAFKTLTDIGITEGTARELAQTCEPDRVTAWVRYAENAKRLTDEAAFVVKKLAKTEEWPPKKRSKAELNRHRYIEGKYADHIEH